MEYGLETNILQLLGHGEGAIEPARREPQAVDHECKRYYVSDSYTWERMTKRRALVMSYIAYLLRSCKSRVYNSCLTAEVPKPHGCQQVFLAYAVFVES